MLRNTRDGIVHEGISTFDGGCLKVIDTVFMFYLLLGLVGRHYFYLFYSNSNADADELGE